LDRASLIREQKEDANLLALMQKSQEEASPYVVREGVLMFVPPTHTSEQARIVVPEKWRDTVLSCRPLWEEKDHSADSGRVSLARNVEGHSKTCSRCLTWNSKKTHRAPLQPLPVISTPWEMVATDVVGPLPRTK
jgi:hypothetical protein